MSGNERGRHRAANERRARATACAARVQHQRRARPELLATAIDACDTPSNRYQEKDTIIVLFRFYYVCCSLTLDQFTKLGLRTQL